MLESVVDANGTVTPLTHATFDTESAFRPESTVLTDTLSACAFAVRRGGGVRERVNVAC